MLKNLTTADEVRSAFRAFTHLRPHLDEDTFVEQALRQMQKGYIMTAILEGGEVVSAAGYRFGEFLAWGKVIYIDDLITHPDARGKGHARLLLDHIKELAIQNNCDAVHLDSGHTRFDAHRVYLNNGYRITSHHFVLRLKD